MQPWESVGRLGVALNFGLGQAQRQVGEAAILDRQIYFELDRDFVEAGIHPR